ncbi:SLC13 family permease [Paenibacillus turpanensis]|uniref:SLC13 family permease n=1 Tax=Paenibacillus turpanensis TaxID=2689078 RepID=UPI0014095758|nr:ArsB/NhaD family transporter [Paenibacillus turpanensis]
MDQPVFALLVFLVAYAFIISEKVNRTIVALAGAVVFVATGIVPLPAAIEHVDWNTIGLLAGMMMIVSITAESGVFRFLALWAAKRAKGDPVRMLVLLGVITAVCSAFLDNVTTILLVAPVTFHIAGRLNISPIPFLLTEVLLSNIGGTATLIGDPPNIMIGSANPETLTFSAFLLHLGPAALIIIAVSLAVLALYYRSQLRTGAELRRQMLELQPAAEIRDRVLLIKSITVLSLTVVGFFAHGVLHIESSIIALGGAVCLMILTGGGHVKSAFRGIEWATLLFFIGLFVLVGGLVETGLVAKLAQSLLQATHGELLSTSMLILAFSAVASAFIDNIPLVATLIPMIQDLESMGMTRIEPIWWSLALGACLGGNGTIIGASANVIAAAMAAKQGAPVSYWRFMKIGFPIMLLSIVISAIYIWFRYF